MSEVLKRKSIVRAVVFALLLTMVTWLVPLNLQEAAAETASTEVVANGDCGDNVHWQLMGDGSGAINGSLSDSMDADNWENIRKVEIGEGITTIGAWALGYNEGDF